MKPGDLVAPWTRCTVTKIKEPTFFSRGRSREWIPGQIATIIVESSREIKGNHVLKFQILLDGELWWTSAVTVHRLEADGTW